MKGKALSVQEVVFGFGAHSTIDDGPELLRMVQQADHDGLDHFSLSDHPYIGERLDAYATVGFVLGRTQHISGFANVTNLPTRPAPMLARTVTSLSALSGGRVVLGMGAGGRWERISDMGVPRLSPADAVNAFEEAIVLVKSLSGGGPPITYRGCHYQVNEIEPARVAAPPVWTGSVGRKSLAATGRVADGWIPGHAADWLIPGLTARHRRSRGHRGPRSTRDPHDLQLPRAHHGPAIARHTRPRRPLDRRFRRPVDRGTDRRSAGARRVRVHALLARRRNAGHRLHRPLGQRNRSGRTRSDREGRLVVLCQVVKARNCRQVGQWPVQVASSAADSAPGRRIPGWLVGEVHLNLLRDAGPEKAEFIPFRVGEHIPRFLAALPDVSVLRPCGKEALELGVLVAVGGVEIEMQAQLTVLGLLGPAENQSGLKAAEPLRRSDLDIVALSSQLHKAQHLAPEPRKQLWLTTIQHQLCNTTGHALPPIPMTPRRTHSFRRRDPYQISRSAGATV